MESRKNQLVVEADAPCDARKAVPADQIAGPKARDLGLLASPGSESAARRQGLPRNLGDLDVPATRNGVVKETKRHRDVEKSERRSKSDEAGEPDPRKRRVQKPGSRHIPVDVERQVRERDSDQCAFTDAEGRRCQERRFLTIEHHIPFAMGGPPTVENLSL